MSKIDNERKRSFIEISIYRILAKLHSTETKWSFRLEVSLSQFKADVPLEIGRVSE